MADNHQPSQPAPEADTLDAEPLKIGTARKSLFSDASVCSNLGKGLRALYMELLREPLPTEFTEPLKKIHRGQE
jgi:hypothetical protein